MARMWQAPSAAKRWVGAQPPVRINWLLAVLFCGWVLLDVLSLNVSTGLARASFDRMVRMRVWAPPPDPRVVIVDIDEASLLRMAKDFGRWPWPRDTLATVLSHIESHKPAAVVWDISFADADRVSPGGDAAFNSAVAKSEHSHFPVIRLPPANDVHSQLTQKDLPNLWLSTARTSNLTPTVALIVPALEAVARSRLGTNNAVPDVDGVVRRFKWVETLSDGSQLASMPMSVARSLGGGASASSEHALIAWRSKAGLYPRVSFADVFAQAEGGQPGGFTFHNKIVLIGSTAPSLHDIHPTPLSPTMPGVESLATLIDNALNGHELREPQPAAQAALAVVLCLALAAWVHGRGISSLAPLLLGLPLGLLLLTYLSMHTHVFVDLQLSAGMAMAFLALLRVFAGFRMDHWLSVSQWASSAQLASAMSCRPVSDANLQALMDVFAKRAPDARILMSESQAGWPSSLRWPAPACCLSVIAPVEQMGAVAAALKRILKTEELRLIDVAPASQQPASPIDQQRLAATVMTQWSALIATDVSAA